VLGDLVLEARPQRAPGDGERDRDRDVRPLQGDVAHHAELDDVAFQLRVDDALERLQHDFAARFHRGTSLATAKIVP
jgi:hypothetical protein